MKHDTLIWINIVVNFLLFVIMARMNIIEIKRILKEKKRGHEEC